MYDYLIVGAGLFGSIFAYEATKQGKKVLVIDKRDHIGGNIYTKNVDGINVHMYGAHIFHTSNEDTWKYINQFTPFHQFINSPIAIYHDEVYNLPFNMNTFSKMWHVQTPKEAQEMIQLQIKDYQIDEPKNLEEQAIKLVGPDIYERLINGYTSKQWGKPCAELPASIIKRLPVRFTYDNNYFNDIYQGIPEGGYTKVIEGMLEGIEVRLKTDFLSNRNELEPIAHKIIYTGMIDEYYAYCFGPLAYRSLRFDTVRAEEDNYQGNAVVNYTAKDIPYTRIIEHKHFDPSSYACSKGHSIITTEFPQNWSVGSEPYYPVTDDENLSLYKRYQELAEKDQHIIFGGRLGTYKYYDMHHVIEAARDLVSKEFNRE